MMHEIKMGDIVQGTLGQMQMVEDFLPLPEELVLWQQVYFGLSESEIDEIEAVVLDRKHFAPIRE